MKLKKIMKAYYREQIDSLDIAGGVWAAEAKGRGTGSRMFNVAFHAVLISLIVSSLLLGRYQPSRLEQQMAIIVERYNVEDRITDSFESLIVFIKKNRNPGGGL